MDSNPIVGIVAAGLMLVALIGLPFWFVIWVRRRGEQDTPEIFQGLSVHNLPTPVTIEVNFRFYYGLITGYRIKFFQVYVAPREAVTLLKRVQTLNLKRGLFSLAFPTIWLKSYIFSFR